MHENRLQKVLSGMKEQAIDCLLISDPSSIFYLTGKWIHPGERLLILYLTQSGEHKLFINELFPVTEELGVEKVWFKDTDDAIGVLATNMGRETVIGIDKNWPSGFLLRLMEAKNHQRRQDVSLFSGYFEEEEELKFVNGSAVMDKVRMEKDEEERQLMRKASALNDQAMGRIIGEMKEGKTEQQMAKRLAEIYEEIGADGFSFDPIIAYGISGSDPHHEPSKDMLKDGDSIIIDIGCIKDSYCSDMTRTVFYKKVSDKAVEVHNIVREANEKAISMIKPGVRFCDIDQAARDHIEQAGYGKYFTHRTGHSIGIDVHDFGDVSSVNQQPIEEGMIFSVEPGIYLPGEFGVRIEDLVLVTKDGCEVLNKFDKGIIIIA